MTRDELLQRYAAGERDFRGVDLSGVDLSGVDLSGVDLSGANLYRANLSGANLSGAKLSRANLYDANLSGATLSGANLSGAKLSGVKLSRANLYDANLSGATLSGATLSGANLSGVDLSGANLYDANLSGANLLRVDLWAAKTLVGTRGVYSAYAIGMSSRNDTLCGGVDDEFNLKIQAGCFSGTPDEFRAAVATTHGVDSPYAQRYMLALQFIEQCFALDADKWAEMKAKLEKGEES